MPYYPGASAGAASSLVIQEADGSPSGTPTVLVLPNTTLGISGGTATYTPTAGGGSVVFADEGSPVGTGTVLNFVGAGVTATFSSGTAIATISGGGGGGTAHEDFWTPPDSAGTYDEEFAGTADTLPTNWSWTTEPNSGGNSWKLNSTWKRTLMIERALSDTTTFELRRTSLTPGAVDCGFWWYMDIGLGRWNNNGDTIEVLFRDSTGNSGNGFKMLKSSSLSYAARNRTGGTTSDTANETTNDTRFGSFFGVTRKNSDNTWRAFISADGRSWEQLGVTTTNSFTIDHMQVTFTSGNNQGVSRIFFGPLRYRADLLQWAPR